MLKVEVSQKLIQNALDMRNEERIQKIEELLKTINPLNYERIFLETSLQFTKEKYLKEFGESDQLKIIDIQNKLNELNKQLNPKFQDLRKLQCKYEIEYEGQVFDAYTNSHRWDRECQMLHLTKCCDVNTFDNGWEVYKNNSCINDLIVEIHNVIYNLKYTHFKILNVKQLS